VVYWIYTMVTYNFTVWWPRIRYVRFQECWRWPQQMQWRSYWDFFCFM
jgi:hypothetical protein